MKHQWKSYLAVTSIVFLAGACADDEVAGSAAPYDSGSTVVIGGGEGGEVQVTPSGDDCVQTNDACVKVQETCGEEARADVIVDADGNFVKTVCYPGTSEGEFDRVEGSVKTDQNGRVYVLDDEADGEDITNNVEFKGNDAVLYGQGEDVSVIGGNLKVVGNNAVIRGVRIKGNVDLEGDDGVLTLCVIEGNLHVKSSGNIVSECEIYGDVKFDAASGSMISNRVQKNWTVKEETVECSGNREIDDANQNFRIDEGELGDPLLCPTD